MDSVASVPYADISSRLRDLADDSRFSDAHALLVANPDVESWTDPEAIWEAARVLFHTGAPKRSSQLVLRAYRRNPTDPILRVLVARERLERRGPWFAWQAWREAPEPDDLPTRVLARWWLLGAHIASLFRDRSTALALLDRAEATGAATIRARLGRAFVLEREDRFEEALSTAQSSLEDAPGDLAAVEFTSRLMHATQRHDQAMELLEGAINEFDSAHPCLMHATIALERQRYEVARTSIEVAAERYPAIEPDVRQSLDAMLANCAYYLGERRPFIDLARSSAIPELVAIAERVEKSDGSLQRVQLDVPFVQQHHATCVPATLTSIAQYWKRSVDHVEVADAICYDGTKAHVEREWTQTHGWFVREFTLTWDTAVALLDAGLPFAVVFVDGLQGHMRAAMGYDPHRCSLLFRDPSISIRIEVDATKMLEHQRPYGPRALLILPPEEASRADGIELPDAALHDQLSALHAALGVHDRSSARALRDAIQERAPEHRIALFADRAIALYDKDPEAILAVCERLIALHPDDWSAHAQAWLAMTSIRSPRERKARIEALLERDRAHPAVLELVAAELAADARQHERSSRLLRTMLRIDPMHAGALNLLGRVMWSEQRFDEALDLLRFAARLAETDDGKAVDAFQAFVGLGRTEEGVALLVERAERYRKRSSAPTRVLFEVLESLDRVADAFDSLAAALQERPDDGELMLFAARAHARYGRPEKAKELLYAAKGMCAKRDELHAVAVVTESGGQSAAALESWRSVVQEDPFGEVGHVAVARLLTVTEGMDAARAHMAKVVAAHPYRQDLARLYAAVLDGGEPTRLREALEEHLERVPGSAWAWRRMAQIKVRQGDVDGAREAVQRAVAVEPEVAERYLIEAYVELRAGDHERVRTCLRSGIALNPDSPAAITAYANMAESAKNRREILAFVAEQVRERSVDGSGVLAWFSALRTSETPTACVEAVECLRIARPELWATWSVAIQLACSRGKKKTALELVREAKSRFPTVAELCLDAAELSRLRDKPEGVVRNLERAYRLSGQPEIALQLHHVHRGAERDDEARATLERALRRHPLHPDLLVAKAVMAWEDNEQQSAIDAVENVLLRDPNQDWAWRLLSTWSTVLDRHDRALGFALKLVQGRQWDAGMMLRYGVMQFDAGEVEDSLDTVERAAQLDPFDINVLELQAQALFALGRERAALAVCARARAFPGAMALPLRGREAWIRFHSGERQEARQRMMALVETWPGYLWGVRQLVEWFADSGDLKEAASQARALTKLEPLDPASRVLFGEVLRAQGDQAAARKAFDRALALDPAHVPALTNTIRLCIEADELEGAESVLARIGRLDRALEAYWRSRIALAQRDSKRFAEEFFNLLDVGASQDLVTAAVGVAAEKRPVTLATTLREAIERHPEKIYLGELWATAACHFGPEPSSDDLNALYEFSPALGAAAIASVLEINTRAGRWIGALWLALLLGRTSWRNDLCWGAVGLVLQSQWVQPLAPLWFRGCQEREGLKPWMLLNLAFAWRRLYAYQRARATHQHALALKADASTNQHKLWLAYYEAADGDVTQARALVDVPRERLDPFAKALRHAIEALLIARGEDDGPEDDRWLRACVELGHGMGTGAHPDALARLRRRTKRLMAKHAGKPFAWAETVATTVVHETVRWTWPWVALAIVGYLVFRVVSCQ